MATTTLELTASQPSSTNSSDHSPADGFEALDRAPGIAIAERNGSVLEVSYSRTVALILCITSITAIGNLLAGLLTICIPVIVADLDMPHDLQLWPASAFALACGCTLLPCGAMADILGCRRACLLGALVQSASSMGAGLAKSSTQLIVLRALAGVAASCCLPGAVGVVSRIFPANTHPKRRNAAFAAMGGGQAIGFGLGLVLGGICADKIGWRWGFYSTAILNGVVLLISLWALPLTVDGPIKATMFQKLRRKIDWIGASIISLCLALLSYELANATGVQARHTLSQPYNIILLCFATALVPGFALWMRRQTKCGSPALIPNALWKNVPFTTVCATVFMVWGALNASEQLTALYLQDVRGKSVLTASLYFLPAPIAGLLMNATIGLFLPRIRPSIAVPAACLVSGVAPLLLALLCRTDGPSYWSGVFQAMALNPIGADLTYVIANLVFTDAFPEDTQALAGAIFNMIAQLGKSVGIATTVVIARNITTRDDIPDKNDVLLRGYKAGWLYNCALGCASVIISVWGLKNVRRIGTKQD